MARRPTRRRSPDSEIDHIPLDKQRIVDAALTLLNEVGLHQLTMRNLAEALGVKVGALYWHIRNKEDLLQQLAEQVCAEVQFPENEATWQEKIRKFMFSYREVMLKYRDSAQVLAETAPITPKRQELIGKVFGTFMNMGFSEEESIMIGAFLNNYALWFVIDEMHIRTSNKTETTEQDTSEGRKSAVIWQLPSFDRQYQFGLDMILDGLNSRLHHANP